MYALVRTPESGPLGTIVSRHRSEAAAEAAYDREVRRTRRRYPGAMTHLMYRVSTLPTAAGDTGTVGDHVRITY